MLKRDMTNAILAGVCAGIAKKFDIDPIVVRILWLLTSAFWGAGILLYIIMAIIMTKE